jgi:GMP synthase PP-ATPase subunit
MIALRSVKTIDFMTAQWTHLPYGLLDVASRWIVGEIAGVLRVVYDVSGKPQERIALRWGQLEAVASRAQNVVKTWFRSI